MEAVGIEETGVRGAGGAARRREVPEAPARRGAGSPSPRSGWAKRRGAPETPPREAEWLREAPQGPARQSAGSSLLARRKPVREGDDAEIGSRRQKRGGLVIPRFGLHRA